METAAPDPLDKLWTPEQRAAARDRCRKQAIEAADATIANVLPEHLEAFRPDVYRDDLVESWLKAHDEYVARAAAIMGAPEAEGREDLARRLVLHTKHSAQASVLILRDAGTDVSALPVGGERRERLAAMRRAAAAGGL